MILLVDGAFFYMPKGTNYLISARLPRVLVEFIDREIEDDQFLNRSDWVQCACREYMRIRQEQRRRDTESGPLGGGGSNNS